MEQSHNLVLNEEALAQLTESKRPLFIFEWLRHLDKALVNIRKAEIRDVQKKLVDQLVGQIQNNPGPPTRQLIARCLAMLFNVGDTFLLFDAVNKCNDILKNKDDSPSFLPTKLAAITCIGTMYEKLGRMMGRSFEETVTLLLKQMKNAESQTRLEIYLTLQKILAGLGNAANSVHRDIFKSIRHGMVDRVMAVRNNAAKCLQEMIKHAIFLQTTELESVFSLCFRALDGSNYEVRCSVAHVLGSLVAITQTNDNSIGKNRVVTLEEALSLLASGFLKGGIGFLKSGAGEIIKGSSVSRETRVGVTHAYVVLASQLGNAWLERNKTVFLQHLFDLLVSPKSAGSHMDAVYSRKCISFVLRSVLGKQLNEKQQSQAIKELVNILNKYMNAHVAVNVSNANDSSQKQDVAQADIQLTQHVLICALLEMGCLIEELGTSSISVICDPHVGLVDTIASLVIHQSPSARLAASWCLRCIAVSVPSQLTPLIERFLERLETMKSNPETINGYSAALSALLGSVCQTPLGIPHNKGKLIFNIAEDLLRTASQNSRLSLQRTQAGWLLIGAVMTLGSPIVKGLLPRMLLLWKNSFPRSSKELESEKARGDAFTWQITLENRAGALASMASFLTHCNKLATEEVIKRMISPIESALMMLAVLNNVFKNYGSLVKASCATVRLRLYETLLLLHPQSYDSCYTNLLRILVAEFTLSENASNTTSSLLRSFCHSDDDTILGSWLKESDHKSIEDQLQPNSLSGSGAIEHDTTCLYKAPSKDELVPGPLPLGVAVIDKSTLVFASIFSHVAHKHRIQMLNHFQECIKHSKAARQEAIQMNILTAILGALKIFVENKISFGTDEVKQTIVSLIQSMLNHSNPPIRCAAAESLGKCGQIINDGKFVAEMAQQCFDKLKSARDALSRTGHSLALGCLHRYVGSLGSSQHLNTSISILLALAQDTSSPVVQVWALHALTMIADSGGPMFRSYVEPISNQCLKLLLTVPMSHSDVHQCIGKCLSAMITTVGPELQTNTSSISANRFSLLIACSIMQEHNDFLVQAEAIGCLQQMHMFSPQHVNLATLVPVLCNVLRSPHLILRRAAISCLHQLSQREAKEVSEHVYVWLKDNNKMLLKNSFKNDHGFAGMLFTILDHEKDTITVNNIHKIIISLVQALITESLSQWLNLCKEVLTSADSSSLSSPDKEIEHDNEEFDMEAAFKAGDDSDSNSITPRWSTRVFATQILCRIINACENSQNKIHFDLALARERHLMSEGKEDFLVLHLSDLIRMSFIAATSDSDLLRMEGLKALQFVIDKFSSVPEPEFPKHVILEQYQAQVGAALRPAFSQDTPPHVTAMACQVCSAWIGSGVARDLNDLRRVHQLLVSSLTKLQKDSCSRLYNESASTIEKLAILKAWAEVYVVAMTQKNCQNNSDDDEDDFNNDYNGKTNLLQLVTPELVSLSKYWLSALKDHALLTLPSEFSSQLPHDGGTFYSADTIELARPRYRASWPPILHAAALWLCSNGFELDKNGHNSTSNEDHFYLLFGICMEALCNPKSTEPISFIIICLKSLQQLLSHPIPESIFAQDYHLSIELCNVLHRLLLTRDNPECQTLVLDIALLVCNSHEKHLEQEKKKILKELAPANQEPDNRDLALESVGEGGKNGEIIPGESLVFALLEVCLCVLVRQLPQLSPSLACTPGITLNIQKNNSTILNEESAILIGKSLKILSQLPYLCSPKGTVVILPSIMHLITGVLKECALQTGDSISESHIITMVFDCLKSLGSSSFTKNSISRRKWIELLQSTLASILDWSKTSSDEPKPDQITILLAVSIFIMNTPSDVIKIPNLQYPCINLLTQALQSENEFVRFKCIQTIKSIFQQTELELAVPYIHALAPRLIELLNCLINKVSFENISKTQFDSILELFDSLEVLIQKASNDKKINLLNIYLPFLITILSDGTDNLVSKLYIKQLHDYALKKLTTIGPKYPNEFRQIVGLVPKFKTKLENAIRNQRTNIVNSSSNSESISNIQREKPSIKLKVDFSNYVEKN